jgi:UDP-N-acetylglucosamine transferase subunit ALG13
VIFATVGSSPFPFQRMMFALRNLPAADLRVQHGPAEPPPCVRADAYLPFDRMVDLIERSDLVVCHAGVGSIMCALQAGHIPVIFPRLKRHAETVDDHQVELAEALAPRGAVVVAWTAAELLDAVASVPRRSEVRALDAEQLILAVHAAIRGETHRDSIPKTVRNRVSRWICPIRGPARGPERARLHGPFESK